MSAKLETYGNETMNLENVLLINILESEYFKEELYNFRTFQEVVDEIYNNVSTLEPWQGLQRQPSTAFCLLYKLHTLKLTVNQMNALLNHRDSPYIRAMGFLYLRYTCPPKKLWAWFEPFKFDEEEFLPRGNKGPKTTIGKWIRGLLTENIRYFETVFPRIPIPVQRDLNEKLRQTSYEEQEWELEQEEAEREKNGGKARQGSRSPDRKRSRSRSPDRRRDRRRSPDRRRRDRSRSPDRRRSRSRSPDRRRDRRRSPDRRRDRSRSPDRRRRDRSRSPERRRSRSPGRRRDRSRSPEKKSSGSPLGSPPAKRDEVKGQSSASLEKIRQMYGGTTSTKLYASQPSIGDSNSCEADVIRVGFTKKQ